MKRITGLLIFAIFFQLTAFAGSDEGKRKKKNNEVAAPAAPKKKDSGVKKISEATKKCSQFEGFFTVYQDTTEGKTYLEISEDKIGSEIIYFKHILDGVAEARAYKGNYRDIRIFKVEKYFDKIQFVEQNQRFYFDPKNPLSKAAEANINEPIVFSEKIIAMSKDSSSNKYLIASDNLFLSETINQVKSSFRPGSPSFNLGKLNKSKSRYETIKNYPKNTDVVVEYAFDNAYPTVYGGDAITNSRYVSVTIQHSFIELPDSDYQPRFEDSRIGYFTQKVTDLTSASATPYRDVINRWHLKKKNPEAALSEPIEPITWWIENTTPLELRDIIKAAGLKWNEAFEQAGFKNALVIKQQPDDAEWDAGDIRYNVLRWTSSPQPPWGGYGPSLADPRTGQIIAADIMLEYVYLTNRLKFEKAFDLAAMPTMQEEEAGQMDEHHHCTAGLHAFHENLFSVYALETLGLGDVEKSKLLHQGLTRLILHELGHTLGLAHNFCGSQLYSIDEMNDPNIGGKYGIASSVMDYHATNIAVSKEKQGKYAIDQPGVYDEWAIEFGYSEFENEAAEKKGLDEILNRSTDPQLCFGNDADDMRSPGRGIDPRMNVSDLSSDAIGFALSRIAVVNNTFPKLKKNLLENGDSYHELRNAYLTMTGNYYGALNVISRYIGGVYIDRSRVGQNSTEKPFTPVPLTEQKRAMNALEQYAFSPNAFQFDKEILNYLKMQRRGWGFRGDGEDPKVHSRVLTFQKNILAHLLHPNVLERMTDSELYGNKYAPAEMLSDLSNAIFNADLNTSVNGHRQNVQLAYIDKLGNVLRSKSAYDYIAQSAALYELNKIKSKMGGAQSPNESTKAHRKHVVFAINKILDID